MARGWESKSVEDQIAEREASASSGPQKRLSPSEAERQAKRDGLLLARARILTAIQSARNETYRAQLESALKHLDSELAGL